jgi:hypothetical protein
MVPAGTRLDYTVTGTIADRGLFAYVQGPAEFRAAVLSQLAGAVLPARLTIDADTAWHGLPETWGYRASVTVVTIAPHARREDIDAIVTGAFWRASDNRPLVTPGLLTQPGPDRSSGAPAWLTWGTIALAAVAVIAIAVIAR